MSKLLWTLALTYFLVTMGIACRLFELSPEGQKAREEGGSILRTVLPPPWGDLAAGAFTVVTGGVAVLKGRQANKSDKEAKKNKRLAEVGVKIIEENPALKKRAKQLSTMLEVPKELDELVHEVIPHGPPKLPDPPKA